MAGKLQGFVDAIRGDDSRAKVQGFLRPIDTDGIAKELDLDQEGVSRGKQELPPSTSTSMDSNEQRIIQRIESEWSWHGAEFINNLKAYSARLLGVTVHTEFARLDLQAHNAL